MLRKLFKHEFRATRRIIPLIWAAAAVMTGVYLLGIALEVKWLTGLSMVLTLLIIAAQSLVVILIVVVRYYQSGFGAEGYLTHTLPVTKGQILLSKAVVGFIWLILSYLITFAGIMMILRPQILGDEVLKALWDVLRQWGDSVGWVRIIPVLCFFLLFSAFELIAQSYFAITAANMPKQQKHSLLLSIVICLAVNTIVSNVCGALTLVLPPVVRITESGASFVMTSMLKGLTGMTGNAPFQMDIGIMGYPLELALDIILIIIAKKILDKKLSLK